MSFSRITCVAFLALTAIRANSADVTEYHIVKRISYFQSGTGTPVLQASAPYGFDCRVSPQNLPLINKAGLQLPNLSRVSLVNDGNDSDLKYQVPFTTKSAMDSAYRTGTYVFNFNTKSDGTRTPSLVLTNDNYPSTPHISNWSAAQAIDVNAGFNLTWDAFSGGTANDYIMVSVSQVNDGTTLWSSLSPERAETLKGTARTVSIPTSSVMQPGDRYVGKVTFVKVVGGNTSGYPGAIGLIGYAKETSFGMLTANSAGRVEFGGYFYATNRSAGLISIPVKRVGGSQGAVLVNYAPVTVPDMAEFGVDYLLPGDALQFADGETQQTIPITLLPTSDDGAKVLRLNLFNPLGGASLGDKIDATLTILDPSNLVNTVFSLAKGQSYVQTNGSVRLQSGSPYIFRANVEPGYTGAATGLTARVTVMTANGYLSSQFSTWGRGGQFGLEQQYTSLSNLNMRYPNGTYSTTLMMSESGSRSGDLSLGGNGYPRNAPRIANWLEAQAIEPQTDFVLRWDQFTNATADDFITFVIKDDEGNALWAPEPLDGTETAATLPAGLLEAGTEYKGRLMFANVVGNLSLPGANGVGLYFRQTDFIITTMSPSGRFQFSTNRYTVGESNAMMEIPISRIGGSDTTSWVTCSTPFPPDESQINYVPTAQTLTFGPGETAKVFQVQIKNDELMRGMQAVELMLYGPSDGATLGQPAQTTLTIVDDEALALSDVASYGAFKGIKYRQTNDGPAAVVSTEAPYIVYAFAEPEYVGGIIGARLRRANGSFVNLSDFGSRFGFEALYASKTFFDSAFPNGTNYMVVTTFADGVRSNAMVLKTDSYPQGTPRILDWEGSHDIDSAAPYNITWCPFTNGSASDFILLQVYDEFGNAFFRSGGLLQSNALDGTATGFEITAGTLTGEHNYFATLMFMKRTGWNTNSYPGVPGLSGYFRETTFTLAASPEARPGGRLQFSAREYSVSETGAVANITVTRERGSSGEVSADFVTSDGTAKAGLDYAATAFRLVLADGQMSTNFPVPILDDAILEGTEYLTLSLSDPSGCIVGPYSNATLRIVDNERSDAGTLQFSATNYLARENAGRVGLSVVRSGVTNRVVTVDYATADRSAVAGIDYGPVSGRLTFGVGVISQTIYVPLTNNTVVERSNRVLNVMLFNPGNGASLGARTNATLTITNEDLGGTIGFSTNLYVVSEATNTAWITVKRSGGLASQVSVVYYTADGTGVDGVNYLSVENALVFGAGETMHRFPITLIADDSPDGNYKTVNLSLCRAQPSCIGGARLGLSNAVLRIMEDETAFQFSTNAYFVSESTSNATITVMRTGPANRTNYVNYSIGPGTAIPGTDYSTNRVSGRLTFAPGVTSQSFTVPLRRDSVVDGPKTVLLALSAVTPGTMLGCVSNAVLTINDVDKGGVINFSKTLYTVYETNGSVTVNLVRTNGTAGAVSVGLRFMDAASNSATFGVDYTYTNSTTINFGAGITNVPVKITILKDSVADLNEEFVVGLENPTGGSCLGALSNTIVRIIK